MSETPDLSQALRETAGLEESLTEAKGVAPVARAANGAGSSPSPVRSAPRMEIKPRLTAPPDKGKVSVFSAFWPATPGGGDKEAATALPAAPSPSPPPQLGGSEPVQTVVAPVAAHAAPASVLKSGVVEGMAYTLYSDGSIEAQLPQGALRFDSISALRSHIENKS
jgi:hypothetical protein